MNTQFIFLTQGELMRNRVLEVALDVYIPFTARDDPSNRAHLQQHTLEIEEIITAEHRLAVSCKDTVQITHCEFMPQFGEAAATSLLGIRVNQITRHEDIAHHEILQL